MTLVFLLGPDWPKLTAESELPLDQIFFLILHPPEFSNLDFWQAGPGCSPPPVDHQSIQNRRKKAIAVKEKQMCDIFQTQSYDGLCSCVNTLWVLLSQDLKWLRERQNSAGPVCYWLSDIPPNCFLHQIQKGQLQETASRFAKHISFLKLYKNFYTLYSCFWENMFITDRLLLQVQMWQKPKPTVICWYETVIQIKDC